MASDMGLEADEASFGMDGMSRGLLPSPPAAQTNDDSDGFRWKLVKRQLGLCRKMAFPYLCKSSRGRWLLLGLLVLTLAQSGVTVVISYLNKDFTTALAGRNVNEFYIVLVKYLAAFVIGSPVTVLYTYQRAKMAVHWREWMTAQTFSLYVTNRVYYKLERNGGIDNPDQRISEDIKSFTSYSLELGITCLTSFIDLVSFSIILWSIYAQLFASALVYAACGTLLTAYLGRTLVGLNFAQLRKEADLRYALVRLRENSESIAFYAGEDLEGSLVEQRVTSVMDNQRSINRTQKNLEYFTSIYGNLVQILPVALIAPKYFAGKIVFGAVGQAIEAFNHIAKDLCIVINMYEQLSAFSAGVERLGTFYEAIQADSQSPRDEPLSRLDEIPLVESSRTLNKDAIKLNRFGKGQTNGLILSIQNLDLKTPDAKRTLIWDLDVKLSEGEHLLIVGSSGAGKSSLLRAIAGLWTLGKGAIARPCDEEVYFLPQRPYCALGSLKDQLLYPSLYYSRETSDDDGQKVRPRSHLLTEALANNHLLEILEAVDLLDVARRAGDGDVKKGLQATMDWTNMLSLGEQQRLAFGRLLVNRPRLVILDEATSALDLVAEARMYQMLQNMAQKTRLGGGRLPSPALTYISVGHRPSLLAYHNKRLRLLGESGYDVSDIQHPENVLSNTERDFKLLM